MEKTREQAEPQITPGKGLRGDVERLKANSSATAEELREFVGGLKGRSPQEVLGIVSATGLFKGTIQATVGMAVVLAVFTVLPWAIADEKPEKDEKETAKASGSLFAALDTNADGILSAAEMESAPQVLGRLDKNNDKELTLAELGTAQSGPAPSEAGGESAVASSTPGATGGEVDPAKAIKAMGEDEVKPADASTDPLDNTLNNLLELKD